MTKEYVLEDIEKLTTFNFKPNCSITFHRGKDKVGALDFNGPEMTFSGDMDESAKLFLEFIATSFKARLEQERAEERKACAEVGKYALPNHPDLGLVVEAAIRARGQA